jgi:hypothetical protein
LSWRRYSESVEDEIKRLELELYRARHTVLGLVPEQFRECLDSFRSVRTRRDFDAWQSGVIEKIIELTEGGPEDYFGSRRAPCPLCKDEGSGVYAEGFKLDEGLRRHLTGWGQHTRQCGVMREAFALAEYSLRDKILEADQAEAEAEERTTAERRKTERLFVVNPSEPQKLINESFRYFRDPNYYRDAEGLAFAEQRLRDIGFEIETTDRVTTCRFMSDECTVLADPREKGRISFLVYMQNPKRKKTSYLTESFHLLDSWKNELPRKFMDRLAEAKDAIAKRR